MRIPLSAGLLVIAATVPVAAGPAKPDNEPLRSSWFSCPAERRVHVSLDAWSAAMEARPGRAAEDVLLGNLGLAPVPDPASAAPAPSCKPGEEPQLRSIEVIPVDLTDASSLDRVVRVRYETCDYPGHEGMPLLSQRVQVLRPIGEEGGPSGGGAPQLWCTMGADLSVDRAAWELPCNAGLEAREIAFENVVDSTRKSIRVSDVSGACDDAIGTWAERKVSFWDASGRTLSRIFTAPTFELDGSAARVRTVKLEGEFPRRIVVTERDRCLASGEPGLPAPDCEDVAGVESTATFSWAGGAYRAE